MASAAGLGRSFGLAGTTGVEGTAGAGAAASWPGLKSRRRFGLGAGEMGREGVGAGAVTSAGLLTVFVEVMFSNRARREDTGFCRPVSQRRSPRGWEYLVQSTSHRALLRW